MMTLRGVSPGGAGLWLGLGLGVSRRAVPDCEGVWQDSIERRIHISVAPALVICCRDFEDYQPSEGFLLGSPEGRLGAWVKAARSRITLRSWRPESVGMPALGEGDIRYQVRCTSAYYDGSALSTERNGAGSDSDCDCEGLPVSEWEPGGCAANEFGW